MDEHQSKTDSSSIRRSNRLATMVKRFIRIFCIVVILLGLIVFSAPWIISTSPVRQLILNQVNRSIEGTLAIRSWTIRWIKGIEINGVLLTMPDRQTRFEAGGIRIAFSLPSLAKAGYALSRVEKGNPIHTDLEGEIDLFRGRVSAAVQPDAMVLLTDLNAVLKVDGLDKPCSLLIAGKQGLADGSISITGMVQVLSNGVFNPETVKGNVTLSLQDWDLAPIISVLNTNGSLPDIDGQLGGALTVGLEGINDIDVKCGFAMQSLRVRGDSIPGGAHTFDKIDLQIDIGKKGQEVSIKTLVLDGPLIQASVSGDLTLSHSNTLSMADLKIDGRVNLANVITLLPEQMRSTTTPTASGRIGTLDMKSTVRIDMTGKTNFLDSLTVEVLTELDDLDISTLMAMSGTHESLPRIQGQLQGKLDASLEGIESLETRGTIVLNSLRMAGGFLGRDKPSLETVRLDVDLARSGQKVMIKTCSVNSALLNASISGDVAPFSKQRIPPANLVIKGRLNAAEAARQFPDTLNLQKELTFSRGTLELNAQCETDKQSVNFEGTLKTSDLTAQSQGRAIQLDKPIILYAKGTLGENDFQLERFELSSSFLSGHGSGNMEEMSVDLKANLAAALKEAAKFIDLMGKSGAGQLTVQMALENRDQQQTIFSAKASLSDFKLSGFTANPVYLNNVNFDLGAAADLDEHMKLRNITDMSLSVLSELASIRMKGERLSPGRNGSPLIQGLTLHAESDLARLMNFIRSFAEIPEDTIITGKARLTSQCSLKDNVLTVPRFDISSSPFTFRHKDNLIIDKALSAGGTITLPVAATNASDLLRETDMDSIMSVKFIKFLGIEMSNLTVPLRVHDNLIHLKIESMVNQGKIILPLCVDAGQDPATLSIPDNSEVLRGVKLTNEMIDKLVGFVSPLLKGCVITKGFLNASIKRCIIPLGKADIWKMQFESLLSLRSVTLASAGVLFDILSLAKLQGEAISIRDQDIHSVYRNGRIHSSQMIMNAGGYDIVISGSVGLDETLDYMIRIPITRKMVGRDVYKHLKGETISLPVGGTVNNPAFNRKKFLAEVTKTAGRVGSRLLIEEGSKFLRDLLKK